MQLELWGRQPTTRHNVFFGLSLPAAKAERIMQLMQGIVGRLCLRATLRPVDLLHVSLVGVGDFTGPLPVGMIEAAKVGVSTLQIAAFDVTFSSVASYGGGAIVLQARAGDRVLVAFREALKLALWKAGVRLPEKGARNGFSPHVTMAYGDWAPEFFVDPISWTVDEFVLIDSWVGQSKHVALGRWPLSA
jgi:RNA 2',3'-cyclic 3'-phosphodiesterase